MTKQLLALFLFVSFWQCSNPQNPITKTNSDSLNLVDTQGSTFDFQLEVSNETSEKITDTNQSTVAVFPELHRLTDTTLTELFYAGIFHNREIPINKLDKPCWALTKTDAGGYTLQQTKVIYQPAFDPILDEGSTNPTGIKISMASNDSVWLLFTDLPNLKPGKVEYISDQSMSIIPNKDYSFTYKKTSYRLHATGEKIRIGESWVVTKNYQLFLEDVTSKKKSLVCSFPFFDDSMIQVLFIGDIDNDGKIDLILDNSPKYNSFTPTLYLSSFAQGAELFRVIGMNRFLGC